MKIKNYILKFKKEKLVNYKINKKNLKKSIKKINLGIELLRMILSFLIVLVHFYGNKKSKFYFFLFQNLSYYVPCFFFISFYLSYKIFTSRNIEKIKERYTRILIPYMGWPILFWIKNNYLYYIYEIKGNILIKNIYYQILVGCGIHGIFWFLFNLLFISTLFVIIIFLFNNNFIYILFLITILSYIFIYSNYGIFFFNSYQFYPVKHSISPIPKMILYSFTGFFLSSININKTLYKYRIVILFLSGIFLFIIIYKNFHNKVIFFFKGIILDLGILNIFLFFVMIPFDKINNNIIFSILKQITSYTGGIYYLHPNVFHMF